MFSILILTKNEEKDLGDCLNSVSWCDDIHVFDSYSTDRTVQIAHSKNIKLTQRVFDGFASQRNAALRCLDFKYEWIFILDADERIPQDLQNEIRCVLAESQPLVCGFQIRRKDYLHGTWLKYSQITPYYIRLVKRNKATYHREINEVLSIDGIVSHLSNHFEHFPFSKGYEHWINKHNVYSTMEAARWIEEFDNGISFSFRIALLGKSIPERRYHQKGIFYKMPFRPVIKWLYVFILRRGFLDGSAGLIYATLQSIYEYFIVIKTREALLKRIQ